MDCFDDCHNYRICPDYTDMDLWNEQSTPVPFNGYIIFVTNIAIIFGTIWLYIPKKWRQNQSFKKCYQRYMMGQTFIILTQLAYAMIVGAVRSICLKNSFLNRIP